MSKEKRNDAYKSFTSKEKHYKQNHSTVPPSQMKEAIKEFIDKEEFLQAAYPKVEPLDFYRDIFPKGSFEEFNNREQHKPNGIITIIRDKTERNRSYSRIVFDDLEEITNNLNKNTVIMSPVAFSGRRRLAGRAYTIYGMVIDLDNVGVHQLNDLLYQMENGILPTATYLKNSGTGIHVVYIFNDPIPARKEHCQKLNKLKAVLSGMVWNAYTSRDKVKQFQGIYQGFRVVGSQTKLGPQYRVSAYRIGKKVSIEELNEFVEPEDRIEIEEDLERITLSEAQDLYPEWYERRFIEKKLYGEYDLTDEQKTRRRAWYEAWKAHIRRSARDGNRHYCICVLFTYAYKAKIPLEEAYNDAMGMLPYLNSLTVKEGNDFVKGDIDSAKSYYGPNAMKMSRKNIIRITGIDIGITKRNGNSQKDHLQADVLKNKKTGKRTVNLCKQNRILRYEDAVAEGRVGRPKGSGGKQDTVQEWRAANPAGKKAACIRETGLDKKTVYKWWDIA